MSIKHTLHNLIKRNKSIMRSFFFKRFRTAWMEYCKNIEFGRHLYSLKTTVEFIEREMPATRSFPSKDELLMHCLRNELVIDEGLILEFGVFSGGTINKIAGEVKQTIHGFDSFEGLPEFWRDGYDKGAFSISKPPDFIDNVVIIKGWFNQTLGPFLEKESGSIKFLHVDCDLYSSTKTIFEGLKNRLRIGTVILFDEFFNYPGWQSGEYKAWQELCAELHLQYHYLGYCIQDEQVAVRITGVGKS